MSNAKTNPHGPRLGLRVFVLYDDTQAAMDYLTRVFGFEELFRLTDKDGDVVHGELHTGKEGVVAIGATKFADETVSPRACGGRVNVMLDIQVKDAQAHFERTVREGGAVLGEPAKQFYGDVVYAVRDPEGHVWSFRQRDKTIKPEDWDQFAMKAMGLSYSE